MVAADLRSTSQPNASGGCCFKTAKYLQLLSQVARPMLAVAVVLVSLHQGTCRLYAQTAEVRLTSSQKSLLGHDRMAIGLKTLGGRSYWTDQLVWSDYRIQMNHNDQRCRLLDDRNRRLAVGSFEFCLKQLVCLCRPPVETDQPVVILLHGLSGHRSGMAGLDRYLSDRGFAVISFGYASTQGTIQQLTDSLELVIRNLVGVRNVHLVAHSMGNILVRHLLYRIQNSVDPPDVNFCRMVMISPPNQGAYLADTLGQRKLIQAWFGPSIQQFAPNGGWPELEQQLAVPWFEFGIIAGGTGDADGYFRFLPGDDDGLLTIDSHHLEGCSDFIQLGGFHPFMPQYKKVQQATLKFLQHGSFRG